MKILAPISVGELIDKITILEIKQRNFKTEQQLANIQKELTQLNQCLQELNLNSEIEQLRRELLAVNQVLWATENYKRLCEKAKDFGPGFITAARQVYLKNDQRADIKRKINELCGSDIIEEKIY